MNAGRDPAELRAAVHALLPELWRLVRRGWLATEGGVPVHVRGVESPDTAERLAVVAMAHALAPARRPALDDLAALRASVLANAEAMLLEEAERHGRMVSLTTEEARAALPPGLDDLDRLIESGAPLSEQAPEPSVLDAAAEAIARKAIAALDERTQRVAALRFGGKSEAETAAEVGCSRAYVRARERRVRHHAGHALRVALPEERLGAASLDQLLAGVPEPAITLERMETAVLRRTFHEEPAPYAVRVRWAAAAAAVAAAAWLVMIVLAGR